MWVMHRDWKHLPKPEYIRTPPVYTLVVYRAGSSTGVGAVQLIATSHIAGTDKF